jgi:hypothetical protein
MLKCNLAFRFCAFGWFREYDPQNKHLLCLCSEIERSKGRKNQLGLEPVALPVQHPGHMFKSHIVPFVGVWMVPDY